jgi:hypothetical protein
VIRVKASEHNEQAVFVDTVLYTYRLDPTFLRPLFFAVPNGAFLGGNRFAGIEKLKREGFLPGVSDILYLQPRGGFAYLAIEMKTIEKEGRKDGGLREEQREFLEAVKQAGGFGVVCYGAEQAIEIFGAYMTRAPVL